MKHILALLFVIMFVFTICAGCSTKKQSSQTTEPQETINYNNAITQSDVEAFFNDDDKFATDILLYPAADMSNLDAVMLMILYPLGATHDDPVSFSEFNSYTMKYLNKSYSDSNFEKYATEENVPGNNVIMSKKILYLLGLGGEVLAIDNIEIVGNDTAVLTCACGFNWYELDTIDEVMFSVQFGRADSQLYIKDIWSMYPSRISSIFPGLGNNYKCFWKENIVNSIHTIGTNSYWMKGFIFLDSATLTHYKEAYKWSDMPDDWQPSLSVDILKTNSLKWSSNMFFDSLIESTYDGHLYIDLKNGIVFFDLYK